jgi:hypothetical protein
MTYLLSLILPYLPGFLIGLILPVVLLYLVYISPHVKYLKNNGLIPIMKSGNPKAVLLGMKLRGSNINMILEALKTLKETSSIDPARVHLDQLECYYMLNKHNISSSSGLSNIYIKEELKGQKQQ